MKEIYKLEDLADELVPEHFIQNAPQFYELIKSFLRNIQDVQQSINDNFLDTIDYDRIQNNDFKRLLLKTYVGTLDFDDVDDIESLGDLIKVSKDLSIMKGSSLIFNILIKLLIFILPNIGNTYNELLRQYLSEEDEIEKAILESQLTQLKNQNQSDGQVAYDEYYDEEGELIPFRYKLTADITEDIYYKYIRRFCHPAGWHDTFIPIFIKYLEDDGNAFLNGYDGFTMYDMFSYPLAINDGSVTLEGWTPGFPTSAYQPALLGVVGDYASIVSKISSLSNIIVENGNVYYAWDDMAGPVYPSTQTKGLVNATVETPTDDEFIVYDGGYTGDTTNIGTANGSLTCGTYHITYRVIANDIKE